VFLGRVVGSIWSTVKWPAAQGLKLLLVRPYTLADLGGHPPRRAPESDLVVCADVLDAGVGDDVVIAYGHAARVAVAETLGASEQPGVPIDAAVVAVVDRVEVSLVAPEGSGSRGSGESLPE
jgi:ethanolamine utilization protein EutN